MDQPRLVLRLQLLARDEWGLPLRYNPLSIALPTDCQFRSVSSLIALQEK